MSMVTHTVGMMTNKIGQVRNASMPKLKYVVIVEAKAILNLGDRSRSTTLRSEDTCREDLAMRVDILKIVVNVLPL